MNVYPESVRYKLTWTYSDRSPGYEQFNQSQEEQAHERAQGLISMGTTDKVTVTRSYKVAVYVNEDKRSLVVQRKV